MYLPSNAKGTIVAFVNKFPFPTTNDVDSANWTHKLCEQLAYSYPGDGWGHKSAGIGRPHSADVIAISSPFIGWDIIRSAGSPEATLVLGNESIELLGQIFEPVAPVNHLSVPTPEPLPDINAKLDEILANQVTILQVLENYHKKVMDSIAQPRVCQPFEG